MRIIISVLVNINHGQFNLDNLVSPALLIGIDIGGTFTDFVIHDPITGCITTDKRLTTPSDPSQAVTSGLEEIISNLNDKRVAANIELIITHGSTVATNALLERKGARTALITTSGFRDVLEIGRQDRPELYDLNPRPREQIIPRNWRFEIVERTDNRGRVLKAIDRQVLPDLISKLKVANIESVAICLLFSFLNPEHEQLIARELSGTNLHVSLSSEILPEYREYERTSTTAVNAYVTPVIDRYLASLDASLADSGQPYHLRIMQSNGGIISVDEARKAGVRCIVSGPAGGIVGASNITRSMLAIGDHENHLTLTPGDLKLITFDMGGTSTDVSLVDGKPTVTTESIVGGFPVGVPMLDVHTIGAGGGSIASVDLAGALRVGPQSAGAVPGPACYGLGDSQNDLPTVTDANVVLGRLPGEYFLGGTMPLHIDRSFQVMKKLGAEIGLSAVQAAQGVVDVINAHMERALRLVTIERGHDPEDFLLLSFGGAGGLHAAALARRLSIPRVVVPPMASTLSAYGMLAADVIRDYSRTVMFPGDKVMSAIGASFEPLLTRGKSDLVSEGFREADTDFFPSLDMRYRGQSYELNIPFHEEFLDAFHQHHERQYGYALRDAEVEIVNIRLRATGKKPNLEIPRYPQGDQDASRSGLGVHKLFENGQEVPVQLFQGELLKPGDQIAGPALIIRKDTTIYLPSHTTARADQYLNLLITFEELVDA